ncbi:MAG: hypothetical protein OEZ06_16195 [Myxococcales bacterium]|nr:hypothetical protein [Myxococcales bacterium]
MDAPREVRLSLQVPRELLGEGIEEVRHAFTKLKGRRAWAAVKAAVGMVHTGSLKRGWWNLHLHVFYEADHPLDRSAVTRAWKAITSPKNRARWRHRKHTLAGPTGGWREGTLAVLKEVRDIERTSSYVAGAAKFTPGEELGLADFAVLRAGLKGKQLIVSQGLNGRGRYKRPSQLALGDVAFEVEVPRGAARLVSEVLSDLQRGSGTSDSGVVLENLCLAAYWPGPRDRWRWMAEVLTVVEAQLGAEIIAFDADTDEFLRGCACRLMREEGEGWNFARQVAVPLQRRGETRGFTFVLHDDREQPPRLKHDITQIEFVRFVMDELASRLEPNRGEAAVLETLVSLFRATKPGTPPRTDPSFAGIVELKRREVLPVLEAALGLNLVACDPVERVVFYGAHTADAHAVQEAVDCLRLLV